MRILFIENSGSGESSQMMISAFDNFADKKIIVIWTFNYN